MCARTCVCNIFYNSSHTFLSALPHHTQIHRKLKDYIRPTKSCHFNFNRISPGGYIRRTYRQLHTTNFYMQSTTSRLTYLTCQYSAFTRHYTHVHDCLESASLDLESQALPLCHCLTFLYLFLHREFPSRFRIYIRFLTIFFKSYIVNLNLKLIHNLLISYILNLSTPPPPNIQTCNLTFNITDNSFSRGSL